MTTIKGAWHLFIGDFGDHHAGEAPFSNGQIRGLSGIGRTVTDGNLIAGAFTIDDMNGGMPPVLMTLQR